MVIFYNTEYAVYSTELQCTTLTFTVEKCTLVHCSALHSLYCIVLHISYYTILYYTVLYCTVCNFTVIYCTSLYYNVHHCHLVKTLSKCQVCQGQCWPPLHCCRGDSSGLICLGRRGRSHPSQGVSRRLQLLGQFCVQNVLYYWC